MDQEMKKYGYVTQEIDREIYTENIDGIKFSNIIRSQLEALRLIIFHIRIGRFISFYI